jgi:hypothetical protein
MLAVTAHVGALPWSVAGHAALVVVWDRGSLLPAAPQQLAVARSWVPRLPNDHTTRRSALPPSHETGIDRTRLTTSLIDGPPEQTAVAWSQPAVLVLESVFCERSSRD